MLVLRFVLITINNENSCSTRLVEMGRLNTSSHRRRILGHLLESGLTWSLYQIFSIVLSVNWKVLSCVGYDIFHFALNRQHTHTLGFQWNVKRGNNVFYCFSNLGKIINIDHGTISVITVALLPALSFNKDKN